MAEQAIEVVKKVKKKRGRKPKPVDPNAPKKVLKKRGRKPKPVDPNAPKKVPQKRGRKPKNKKFNVVNKVKTKLIKESLILFLPIKSSDIKDNEIFKYNPLINDPKPYEPSNIKSYSVYNNINTQNEINKSISNTKSIVDDIKKNLLNSKNNKIMCDDECKEVVKKEIINNDIKKDKLINIQYELINMNKNKKWPERIFTACLWCCHKFDNIPISLPESYTDNIFKVSGFFCSFNCAASYNFSLNDTKIWNRYSLLNLLYKKINNCTFVKIPLAPSREVLKHFGGYMDIEEYRENLKFQEKNKYNKTTNHFSYTKSGRKL